MVLLFFIALFLAWPTLGLSLVAYAVAVFIKARADAKARMHYANEQAASRAFRQGATRLPSWATDEDEFEVFFETVRQVAIRKRASKDFVAMLLRDEDTLRSFLYFAGAMEAQGASFTEQQVAVTDKLVAIWNEFPENYNRRVRAKQTAPDLEEIPF